MRETKRVREERARKRARIKKNTYGTVFGRSEFTGSSKRGFHLLRSVNQISRVSASMFATAGALA
eukprot:5091259-Pleurochrysis_carterae.AAC.1